MRIVRCLISLPIFMVDGDLSYRTLIIRVSWDYCCGERFGCALFASILLACRSNFRVVFISSTLSKSRQKSIILTVLISFHPCTWVVCLRHKHVTRCYSFLGSVLALFASLSLCILPKVLVTVWVSWHLCYHVCAWWPCYSCFLFSSEGDLLGAVCINVGKVIDWGRESIGCELFACFTYPTKANFLVTQRSISWFDNTKVLWPRWKLIYTHNSSQKLIWRPRFSHHSSAIWSDFLRVCTCVSCLNCGLEWAIFAVLAGLKINNNSELGWSDFILTCRSECWDLTIRRSSGFVLNSCNDIVWAFLIFLYCS